MLALSMAQACASEQASYGGQLNFGAISGLAGSAGSDAEELEEHADAIAAAAGSTGSDSLGRGVAADARASARTLRVLAANARAVVRVHQQGVDDPGGMLRDGLSLLRPGEMLLRQTEALEGDIQLLRENANSNQALLAALEALASDVEEARGDGRVAIQQGNLLCERARQIARSLGKDIE